MDAIKEESAIHFHTYPSHVNESISYKTRADMKRTSHALNGRISYKVEANV